MSIRRKKCLLLAVLWFAFLSLFSVLVLTLFISFGLLIIGYHAWHYHRIRTSQTERIVSQNRLYSRRFGDSEHIVDSLTGYMVDTRNNRDTYIDISSANERWGIKKKLGYDLEMSKKKTEKIPDQITRVMPEDTRHVTASKKQVNPVISRITDYAGNDRVSSITEKRLPDVLEKITCSGAVIVQGASGTGKTTLMENLIKQIDGDLIILDPHAHKGKYENGIQVVSGKDCKWIERAMLGTLDICDERYDEETFTGNPDDYEPISIIIDEYTKMHRLIPDTLSRFMSEASEDFRKANIRAYFFTHSDDVKTLGVAGKSGVLGYFDRVKLLGENGNFEAIFTPKGTKEKIRCMVPFDTGTQSQIIENDEKYRYEYQDTGTNTRENPRIIAWQNAEKILRMHSDGISKNKIIKAVFNKEKNTARFNAIQEVLNERG